MNTNNDNFPLHLYAVGKPYHPDVQSWPETSQYRFSSGMHDLVLFLEDPTEREVQAARTGEAEFAMLFQDGVIMLCHRFGDGLPWSDSAFSIWLVPSAERVLPPVLVGQQRALMVVLLVDASTGILLTFRVVSLSPEFTTHLHEAIRRQARMSFKGKADNDKRVARIRRLYPTTEALVADTTMRCKGGADDPPVSDDGTGYVTVYVFGGLVDGRGWVAEDAPDAVENEAQMDLPGHAIHLSARRAAAAEAVGVIGQKTIAVGDGSLTVWVVKPAFYHPHMGLQLPDEQGPEIAPGKE
jgi:hypothetical protein